MAVVGTHIGWDGGARRAGRRRVTLGVVTAAALTLAGCGQASDSVTSADRVSTAASLSPEVSAGPQQTTAPSTTAPAPTTSPTVAPTVAAPPTSGGSGEGTVTTLAPPESGQTLPTVVPTSAPDIATTAPTQPTSTTATTAPTPVTPPPAAGSVNVTSVACGYHPADSTNGGRNTDWVVFYLSGPPGAVNVAPGSGATAVSFAPAADVTSGRLFNTSCSLVTEVVLVTNADGNVIWNILHTGAPQVDRSGPSQLDSGQWTFIVKLS